MWPDTRASFVLVYYVASCCGYFAHPAICTLALEPHERVSKQRPSWSNGALQRRLLALEDFCERRRQLLFLLSGASLMLTALACRWTWWWFHGSHLSLLEAFLSIVSVELAGFLLGLGVHQWIVSLLFPRRTTSSFTAVGQMESGEGPRLRITPPGDSPPASPTGAVGRRIV
jgi:hypothetical protein